jgi:hypothetical protein
MEYPREFSPQARARVEAERLRAAKELEQDQNRVPSSHYGPSENDEHNFRKYILRVFLAFAREACKLGAQRLWAIDRVRSESEEFLRRFTIDAEYEKGYDNKQGRKLRTMVSHLSGGILEHADQKFRTSAEWRQFEEMLLALAEEISGSEARSNDKGGSLRRAARRAGLAKRLKSEVSAATLGLLPADRRKLVEAIQEFLPSESGSPQPIAVKLPAVNVPNPATSTETGIPSNLPDEEAVTFHLEQAALRKKAALAKQLLDELSETATAQWWHRSTKPDLATARDTNTAADVLPVQPTAAQANRSQGEQVRKRKGKGRPLSSLVAIRQQAIRKVAETGATGARYCQQLDAAGLATPHEWQRREGCPKKYVDAWNHAKSSERAKWRHRIADEKSRATASSRANSPTR